MNTSSELTIFYDSSCVLCLREMQQLSRLNNGESSQGNIVFVALNHTNLQEKYPHINPVTASTILHAQNQDGVLFLGLDATYQAWKMVGKHKWIQILRWPIIRFFADIAYRIFANNRYRISYLLTGQKPCPTCLIKTDKKTNKSE